MMWVTLYCDGSYNQFTKVGSASIWLKSELGRIVESKVVPDCGGSFDAEEFAFAWGVLRAKEAWPTTEKVLVNTDCTQLIHKWAGRSYSNCRLVFRHVKAHTNGKDRRSYLNRQVDKNAKQLRKEAERTN